MLGTAHAALRSSARRQSGFPGSGSRRPASRGEGNIYEDGEPHPEAIVRREAELPLCLSMGNDKRGFILQPGDVT